MDCVSTDDHPTLIQWLRRPEAKIARSLVEFEKLLGEEPVHGIAHDH